MIRIENLSVKFNDQQIFKDFSFHIKKGEKIALAGESGKGKSTLLNVLAGFIPKFSGSVFIDDIKLNKGIGGNGVDPEFLRLLKNIFPDLQL